MFVDGYLIRVYNNIFLNSYHFEKIQIVGRYRLIYSDLNKSEK